MTNADKIRSMTNKEMTKNKADKYCKLPIPITAYQADKEFDIEMLEGTHHASIGDWIITGVKEVRICIWQKRRLRNLSLSNNVLKCIRIIR